MRSPSDHVHFNSVRRPDASPFLRKEGLLFLDDEGADGSDGPHHRRAAVPGPARRRSDRARPVLRAFAAGHGGHQGGRGSQPLSRVAARRSISPWRMCCRDIRARCPGRSLLGGGLNDLAGKYKFVLVQPKLDYRRAAARRRSDRRDARRSSPGWSSSSPARRACASPARWRWRTRSSPPSSQGAVVGLVGSVVLITLWLFLAVQTWRLIVPILRDAGARPDADPAVRRRRGGHAQSGVGRLRHPVRRHRGGFRHPVLGALSRAALRVSRSGGGDAPERRAHGRSRSWSRRWRHRPASWASCRPTFPAWRSLA